MKFERSVFAVGMLALLFTAEFAFGGADVGAGSEAAPPATASSRPDVGQAPIALSKSSSTRPEATMIGFRELKDGSVQVYVELSAKVEVSSVKKGRTLVYTLAGTSVPRKNNRNPLVATHFHTVLSRAQLVPRKNDTELLIELSADASSSFEVTSLGSGAVLLVNLVAGGAK